jgi:hypothetical protein
MVESGILKSSTIILLIYFLLFSAVIICLLYLGAPMLRAYILAIAIVS